MLRPRLRGIFGTTLATCIPLTALGFLTGVVFEFDLIPGVHFGMGRVIPGGFVTVCTLAGVLVGMINGLAFSVVVLATERGKAFEQLRARRFATWGAVATAGTLGLLIQTPLAAAVGALCGAVGGIAALAIARRAANTRAVMPAHEQAAIGARST